MHLVVTVILEILKFTIPALIVFFTVYHMFKKHTQSLYQQKALELKAEISKQTLPIRLQAYERLLLFCERIDIHHMYYRLNTPNMKSRELMQSMLITVQQEYEYNMAQQLYVSTSLWKIISLAKEQILQIISQTGELTNPDESSLTLFERINVVISQTKSNPLEQAKEAIKKEVDALLL